MPRNKICHRWPVNDLVLYFSTVHLSVTPSVQSLDYHCWLKRNESIFLKAFYRKVGDFDTKWHREKIQEPIKRPNNPINYDSLSTTISLLKNWGGTVCKYKLETTKWHLKCDYGFLKIWTYLLHKKRENNYMKRKSPIKPLTKNFEQW